MVYFVVSISRGEVRCYEFSEGVPLWKFTNLSLKKLKPCWSCALGSGNGARVILDMVFNKLKQTFRDRVVLDFENTWVLYPRLRTTITIERIVFKLSEAESDAFKRFVEVVRRVWLLPYTAKGTVKKILKIVSRYVDKLNGFKALTRLTREIERIIEHYYRVSDSARRRFYTMFDRYDMLLRPTFNKYFVEVYVPLNPYTIISETDFTSKVLGHISENIARITANALNDFGFMVLAMRKEVYDTVKVRLKGLGVNAPDVERGKNVLLILHGDYCNVSLKVCGFEENDKFVRFKLVAVKEWLGDRKIRMVYVVGLDKIVGEPFIHAVPPFYTTYSLKKCVEYLFGLRDEFGRPIYEDDVEIIEV